MHKKVDPTIRHYKIIIDVSRVKDTEMEWPLALYWRRYLFYFFSFFFNFFKAVMLCHIFFCFLRQFGVIFRSSHKLMVRLILFFKLVFFVYFIINKWLIFSEYKNIFDSFFFFIIVSIVEKVKIYLNVCLRKIVTMKRVGKKNCIVQ